MNSTVSTNDDCYIYVYVIMLRMPLFAKTRGSNFPKVVEAQRILCWISSSRFAVRYRWLPRYRKYSTVSRSSPPLIVIEGMLEGVLGIGRCSTLVLPVSVEGESQALIGTGEKIQDGLQSVLGVC